MAQQLMWNQIETLYRGQGTGGTVVTVESDAMELAQKKAGKGVYDSDWWVETLLNVLEHWGIYAQRWIDAATRVPRMHFSTTPARVSPGTDPTQQPSAQEPPAQQPPVQQPSTTTTPINTGSLRERLMTTKKLEPKDES
jgi:hypothetical protein